MYCSNCGHPAVGKFCSQCGNKLASAPAALEVVTSVVTPALVRPPALPPPLPPILNVVPLAVDEWRAVAHYETLICHPVVKDRIARNAARAKPGVTGEMVLEAFDKIVKLPVSSKTVAGVVQPLYAKMGVATGKSRDLAVRYPVGEVIVAALCSLARNGQTVTDVHQHDNGCAIDAKLPSDVFALEGALTVTVASDGGWSRVEAATTIPGQLFDWGKSNRALTRLLNEIATELADDASERWALTA